MFVYCVGCLINWFIGWSVGCSFGCVDYLLGHHNMLSFACGGRGREMVLMNDLLLMMSTLPLSYNDAHLPHALTFTPHSHSLTQSFSYPSLSTSTNQSYQFTNVQLERAYYVEATAPSGFNLTSGVCNDDLVNQGLLDPSWACDNAAAYTTGSSGVGSVNTGRSRECIYVDRTGNVTGVINLGVMQIGDSTPLSTNVALLLNFDNGSTIATAGGRRRHLEELISRATKVSTRDEEAESGYRRYLLSEFDRKTIGTVTAEVVAGNLDERLEANGVQLDAVIADDVMLGVKEDGTNNELAVAMQVHGHYVPPPVLDFDFVVQDSINRDTDNIRRSLREYNDNCRDQTGKVVNQGFSVEDFAEIHSMNGALKNRVKGKNSPRPMGGVFRQSCSENNILPSYFETSLKELKARKVSEVKAELYGDVYVASENRGGLASWAIGPVAGFAGMIALLMGVFVFRRALGPRYADKYQEANKTEKVDIDPTAKFVLDQIAKDKEVKDKEAKRKSRGGGGDDDDSVDSAFYSDADEGEFDETDKERKMRRKKREYEQAAGGRRKQGNRRSKLTASMKELNRSLTRKTKTSEKLSARHGSEDTDGKTSSEEGGSRERQRHSSTAGKRKSKTEGGSDRRKSSEKGERRRSSAPSSSSRRGRSSRSGGDNANASSIV